MKERGTPERDPLERVEIASSGLSIGPVGTYAITLLAGVVAAVVAGEAVGWRLADSAAVVTVAGIGAGAVFVVLRLLGNVGSEVWFHEDGPAVVSLDRHGRETPSLHVPYEEIDLVVRAGMSTDGGETTVSYVLLQSDAPPVTLECLADPQAAERVLRERVPDPTERAWFVEGDAGTRRAVESNRSFWSDWPADADIPSSSVVDRSTLPEEKADLVPEEPPQEEWIPRPTIADQMKTSGNDHWDTGATVPWEWE